MEVYGLRRFKRRKKSHEESASDEDSSSSNDFEISVKGMKVWEIMPKLREIMSKLREFMSKLPVCLHTSTNHHFMTAVCLFPEEKFGRFSVDFATSHAPLKIMYINQTSADCHAVMLLVQIP